MKNNMHRISQNYRDRWSELPEGEYDLHAGDIVDLIHYPEIGSLIVRKQDNTEVSIAGFSGYILTPPITGWMNYLQKWTYWTDSMTGWIC